MYNPHVDSLEFESNACTDYLGNLSDDKLKVLVRKAIKGDSLPEKGVAYLANELKLNEFEMMLYIVMEASRRWYNKTII